LQCRYEHIARQEHNPIITEFEQLVGSVLFFATTVAAKEIKRDCTY
jgi:hypothetical protein